jgi:hypothetical protein
MKYKGKKLEGLNTDVLVLMRNGEKLIFKAQALQNYNEFDKLCPMPDAPIIMRPGGIKEQNLKDGGYQKALTSYSEKKTNYTIIKSLEPTTDLEWEKVKLDDPLTYINWKPELEEAGFTEVEVLRILQLCTRVNCLDDSMLDEAKESFLAEARAEK